MSNPVSDFRYQVGDRVRCIKNHPDGNENIVIGYEGTVVGFSNGGYRDIGVEWDGQVTGGHNFGSLISSYRGWYVTGEEIEPIPDFSPDDVDRAEIDDFLSEFSCKVKE